MTSRHSRTPVSWFSFPKEISALSSFSGTLNCLNLRKHSKKKPDCVIFGRIFDKKLLDMVELQITKFEEIESTIGWNSIPMNAIPVILFHGTGFETDPHKKRIKNLIHDMLNRHVYLEEADLVSTIKFVVSVIEKDDTLYLRFYTSIILPSALTSGTWKEGDNLVEIGPRVNLKILRKNLADEQTYKRAVKYKPYWAEKTVPIL